MRFTALALLLAGCVVTPAPAPPLPPPEDVSGTCETAAENLRKLGGCGLDLARVQADCDDAVKADESVGLRFPVGCLTAAKDCAQARICE